MRKLILVFTFIIVLILGQLAVFGAETVELKIATILPEDSELGKSIKLFKNLTEERSKGEIEVVPYFSAVLGDEKSVVEQLSTGDIEMNVGGSGIIDWHAPKYSISSVPFMYENGMKVMEMMNKIIDERIRDLIIERVGARILGGSLRAPRNLLTVDRRILHPEDVKGLPMRLPPYPSWIKAWEALGAHPTSIPAAEQFSAMQMGVVDATENPVSVLYSLHLYEPCKYLILTEHLHELRIWSISEKFYQKMSDKHKKIINDSAAEAIDWLTQRNIESEQEYIVKLQEEGVQVVIPNQKEFREKMKPIIDDVTSDWAPGIFEEYVKPFLEE